VGTAVYFTLPLASPDGALLLNEDVSGAETVRLNDDRDGL
jgi:hypothetical protein